MLTATMHPDQHWGCAHLKGSANHQFNSGLPIMSRGEIKQVAVEQGGYETPSLNSNLYLHYKGYGKIENLEDYTGLKALWLDSNGFEKIENLSHLNNLRCLFLQRNLLRSIDNLQGLNGLVQLDISENRIAKVEGLSCLPNLSTLNLSKNLLTDGKSISHLSECKILSTIDLTSNQLEGDDVVRVLSNMSNIVAMNIVGNPVVTDFLHFRKHFIVALKRLKYLDRPVFDIERATSEAWALGGRDAELRMKTNWQNKKMEESKKGINDFRAWQAEIRAKYAKQREILLKDGPSPEQLADLEDKEKQKHERDIAAAQEGGRERSRYTLEKKEKGADPPKESKQDYCKVSTPNNESNPMELDASQVISKDPKYLDSKRCFSNTSGKSNSNATICSLSVDAGSKKEDGDSNQEEPNRDTGEVTDKTFSEVEYQDIVEESLAIYRSERDKRKQDIANSATEESCAKLGDNVKQRTTKRLAVSPPVIFSSRDLSTEIEWSEKKDSCLTKYVNAYYFDFFQVATRLKRDFQDFISLDAEACRLRWCLLDSIEEPNGTNKGGFKGVTSVFEQRSHLSFEELEQKTFLKRSKLFKPPVQLPCSNQWSDDDSSEKLHFLGRDEIWNEFRNININGQGSGSVLQTDE